MSLVAVPRVALRLNCFPLFAVLLVKIPLMYLLEERFYLLKGLRLSAGLTSRETLLFYMRCTDVKTMLSEDLILLFWLLAYFAFVSDWLLHYLELLYRPI